MKAATRFGLYAFAGAALTGALIASPTVWMMLRWDAEAASLVSGNLVGALLGYAAALALWSLKATRSRIRAMAIGSTLTNCWVVFVSIWSGFQETVSPYHWLAPTAVFALAIAGFVLFNARPAKTPGYARRQLEPLLRRTPINNLASLGS